MIKEVKTFDLEIKAGEERNFFVEHASGKILKVVIDYDNTDGLTNVVLTTGEDEVVVDSYNNVESAVFYPRVNVSNGRYSKGESLRQEGFSVDYFYFVGTLKFSINSQSNHLIKRLSVIFEE